ncbi:unnamed protein product, partial [Staurois parvus]
VPTVHEREVLHFVNGPVVFGVLSRVPQDSASLPLLPKGPQSLAVPCTMSAVSGHLLYCVSSLWSSPLICPQSLVNPYTMSAVSGHPLYYVRS